MAWGKPAQGFDFGFTGKWIQEGTGKGVIAAEQYHGRTNAEKFSSSVDEHFASMF